MILFYSTGCYQALVALKICRSIRKDEHITIQKDKDSRVFVVVKEKFCTERFQRIGKLKYGIPVYHFREKGMPISSIWKISIAPKKDLSKLLLSLSNKTIENLSSALWAKNESPTVLA
jgi:hypothetical protein